MSKKLAILSFLSFFTLPLAACDTRECQFFNDCGPGARCTTDGRCTALDDPEGTPMSSGSPFTAITGTAAPGSDGTTPTNPANPTNPTNDGDAPAMLDGNFGAEVRLTEAPASLTITERLDGATLTLRSDDPSRALVNISTNQPLQDLLPSVAGEVTNIGFDDPLTDVALCWQDSRSFFDQHGSVAQIRRVETPTGTEYELAAVNNNANSGGSAVSARFRLQPGG